MTLSAAAERLLAALRARRAEGDLPTEAAATVDREIAELTTAVRALSPVARTAAGPIDRIPLAAVILGAGLVLCLLLVYAGGGTRDEPRSGGGGGGGAPVAVGAMARLLIQGELPGATLRVLDADREAVLAEVPAQGAVVELRRGRYALEVKREDCPDTWTRSAYFEAGQTRRFAPSLCSGEGRLIVRSNVADGRLQIDGLDVGTPGDSAHVLGVGDHEIQIDKPGYRPHTARVRIRPDATLEIAADLVPKRPPPSAPRRLDLSFDVEALAPAPEFEPTPFDMGDLAESIAPETAARAGTRLLERSGLGRLPDGGSTAWHDRVSQEFVRRFDRDGSGSIDRVDESEAITCAYWRETEASFDQGGLGLSMARYYGFDGSEWHPRALGFDRSVRGAAYQRMKECGLAA